MNSSTREQELINDLLKQNKTISVVESVTGGGFCRKLVEVRGASKVFIGGDVVYTLQAKRKLLRVSKNENIYTQAFTERLAKSSIKKYKTNCSIAFCGIAGPDTVEGVEVGTIFISVVYNNEIFNKTLNLKGNRNQNIDNAILEGFDFLKKIINN